MSLSRENTLPAVLAVLLAFSIGTGSARVILQSSANPPNPSFGGPQLQLSSSVVPPAGNTVKINWHAVGTQNFSSGSDSQYAPAGAVADFFLQNGTNIVGRHYFISTGSGLSPVFTRENATTGQVLGTVIGRPVANQPAPAYNNDGGYGSIPTLLLEATSADGFFAGVTYIQRTNTLGGVVPGNPKLFTLPASPTGIPNKLLTVPYQANYLFFVSGSPPVSG